MKTISRPKRLVFFVLLVFGFGGASVALVQQPTPSDLLKASDEMVRLTGRLRGLQPKAPIAKEVESRDQIARYLTETVRSNYDAAELQHEGRILQKLGLIPAGMNYVDFMIKLLTEQVGGYYDPTKKKFFIAGWLPADAQKPVMVHELTHALQDQYFDVNAIMEKDRQAHDDDRALAHEALMEGDAVAVMFNYLLEPSGRSFDKLPDLAFVMRAQFWTMDSEFEVFKAAPMYLKEILVFPYGYGAAFLQKVWAKDPSWAAVDKIYSDLPQSTEQIIHPEKYLGARDDPKPVTVEDPSPLLGEKWKRTYTNVLGEFSLFLFLKQYLQEEPAKRAAAGWGGDQIMLVEDGTHDAVFAATTWDSPEEADEFYSALGDWFQIKYPKAQKNAESGTGFSVVQGGEYNTVQHNGQDVRFVIGLPESEVGKLKSYWNQEKK